jgi:hypothetical protein
MKFIHQLKWTFTIGLTILVFNTSNAQLCSPNPSYTNGGVYPDTATALNTGCIGDFYQQDFTVVVPPDTTIGPFTVPINYVQIDSIGGLPPGLTYACNPPTCVFPGGTSQCFQIYGTPTVPGAYHLIIYVHGVATFFGSPYTLNYSYPGYDINIGTHPLLSTGSLSATCNSANGTGWVIAAGSSGYTYSWNTTPVSTNDTIFNQNAGIYQVTVNSLYNCASIDTVVINDVGAPTVSSMIVNDVLCYGDTTGSAILTPVGGTTPYHYLWSTGDTLSTLSNVGAGIYTVSVNDANGCLLSTGATISQPGQLMVFTSQNDATCYGVNNGSAMASAVGGVGTYDYNWTSGSTAASASSLGAGPYTVTVTDDNNCTTSTSLTILQPPVLTTTVNGTGTTCFGGSDGSANVSIGGGSPGYEVAWSNGDTTLTTNGLSAGTYYITVTDTFGCTALDTLVISQPTVISISLTGTNESILGASDGSVDATVSGGTPGYTYLWNNGSTLQDISGVPGGTYIIQVTDINGCTNSDTITIQTLPGFGIESYDGVFGLYPNPATDFIFVDPATNATLLIYDLCGKQMMSKNLNSGLQMIQLVDLTPGVYIVSMVSNEQRKTTRLIVQ